MIRRQVCAAALIAGLPAQQAEAPSRIVAWAAEAVAGDSARSLAQRWEADVQLRPGDRTAVLGLATFARLTYDYPSAERRYRRLLVEPPTGLDNVSVYARLGLAEQLATLGQAREADALLVQARASARAQGDAAAEGEALFRLGHLRVRSAGLKAALALFDSALTVLPPSAGALRAASRCRRAHMLVLLGDPRAPADLAAAAVLARRMDQPLGEGYCLRAREIDLLYRGERDSSRLMLRRLEQLRRRTRDRSGLAETLLWQADAHLHEAAYSEARETLRRALAEALVSHNAYVQTSVELDLGILFLALDDPSTATHHLDRAVARYAATGDTRGVMLARSWQVNVSRAAEDFAGAKWQTIALLDFYRQQGDVPYQSELFQELADIDMRAGDYAAAGRALDSVAALRVRYGDKAWTAALPYHQARLALHDGDLTGAERELTRYLGGLDSSERLSRHEARAYLAEVYARRGDLDRAERELTAAADELDRWRATVADRELRVYAYQASALFENDQNAGLARVLARLAGGGHEAGAFALAERRRARELTDRLLRASALSAGTAAREGDLPRSPPAPVPANLATLIPDDSTAIIEYVTGASGSPTTVFVLSRRPSVGGRAGEPVRARVLPPADSLSRPIERLVTLLESGADPRGAARALGAQVLDPALAMLESRVTRLVVVPDGPLQRLPFDALRLADGRYAVERYAISFAPSAAVAAMLWHGARRGPPGSGGARLLAFGDPASIATHLSESDPALQFSAGETYHSAFAAAGGLPRLRASAREVRLVARYAGHADVRLGAAATAAHLRRTPLAQYDVLHFATHAIVDDRAAARTALALAPSPGESGFVGPGDLAALRLDAELVVLSACRTAGGMLVSGEGVQGLTAPLLQAGARSVVATAWRIGDESTVTFVGAFYAALARGLPVADALRAAKLDALRRGAPASEWAAFTLVGDPLVRVPLTPPHPRSAAGAIALLVALGLLGYGWRIRNRWVRERS